ncbi:NHLP-related RiPP peptide [Stenotrophomonas sp. MH1]|uniref:NHLP-related RiPP peptide n=1 Tax=Stenotrophomonas capsici TaxID=3110230 RepID=A0ABU5UYQ0_9GAMM|nr:NHLP-related RiPP peptide [Stenotrophomonas sp. MH1]MEA5666042.1 NHLP-related RiPP peptide [Stenotrophomonas sp. MH1]
MATKKPSTPVAPVALEPAIADRLLDLLSTDNAFRRAFRKDPAAALVQIGHAPTQGNVDAELAFLRASLTVQHLATKERIAKARAEIRRMLTQGLAMIPIQLNVESKASRRVRK